eukprot:gene983-2602_t
MHTPDDRGGAPCKRDADCQLNGMCTDGSCKCDPAWKGANCSTLDLRPAALANGLGHLGSNASSWGGGVIHDPITGKWIMFVSQMNMGCGLGTWGTNSRCILAEADQPAGPYTQVPTVIDSWCHGATPARDPVSGMWLFNHMGSGQAKENGCRICANGSTPYPPLMGNCTAGGPGTVDTSAALTSESPRGPYTASPGLRNGPNCEAFFLPNGTMYMACPWGGHSAAPDCKTAAFLTMSKAENIHEALAGRFESMPVRTRLAGTDDPYESVPSFCFNWEDQNLWIDQRGHFHTLMHAYRGQPCAYPVCDRNNNKKFCDAVGGHAFSENGYDWDVSPVIAYTPTLEFEDGSVVNLRARERPHLVFGSDGSPTHLINGAGDPCRGGGGSNT